MAFSLRNLSVLAYANGFTLWHYKAGPAERPTPPPDFFADVRDMLAGGDMMLVSSNQGAALLCLVDGDSGLLAVPMLASVPPVV